jgi:hypothetical protein
LNFRIGSAPVNGATNAIFAASTSGSAGRLSVALP